MAALEKRLDSGHLTFAGSRYPSSSDAKSLAIPLLLGGLVYRQQQTEGTADLTFVLSPVRVAMPKWATQPFLKFARRLRDTPWNCGQLHHDIL